MDTKDNNKNIKMLKNELWTRRVNTEAKTILLEEIQKNNTREQEVQKKLEKEDRQTWKDNRIVYMEEKIYIPNNWKIWEKILQENHNPADIEYSEQQRMLELTKRNY